MAKLSPSGAFVEGLVLFFGLEDEFEDGGLASGIEQSVEGLEIFAEQRQQMLLRGLRSSRLLRGWRRRW
jgi:hypothetical protein